MCSNPQMSLYVVHHIAVDIPKQPMVIPLRSDCAEGENIASKFDYCELRAQYYVWKSDKTSDYMGFFHYRRYLDISVPAIPATEKRMHPYRIQKQPAPQSNNKLLLDAVRQFDVIAPIPEYTGISVLERYGQGKGQRESDLRMMAELIEERHPEFSPAAAQYLNGKSEYYGNMYLMRRAEFQAYCAWLFDLLFEFDRRVPNAPPHTDGYLGERLFGIYFTWLCSRANARCGVLPRVHFSCYDDSQHHLKKENLVSLFLAPGSKLRSTVRVICKKKK
ncbi:MAG: DUF4422 domain-containing protein [Pygmaiobacter sp.]